MQPRYLLPVLLLALALALSLWFSRAGRNEGPAASASADDRAMQMVIDTDGEGYGMYLALKCHRCHGQKLRGTRKAPELTRLPEHYDALRLAAYLANPDSMQRADPRLGELDRRFAAHEMPEYRIKAHAMEIICDFLLHREVGDNEVEALGNSTP